MGANEITNHLHAMALVSGSIEGYPNGLVMNALGIKALVRFDVGQYYMPLIEPIEFDVIPDDPSELVSRPPFAGGLVFANDMGAIGTGNQCYCSFVPSDIPITIPVPPGLDPRGGVYIQVRDFEGAPSDNFLAQVFVFRFPTTGASGKPGQWPAIAGQSITL